MILDVSNLLVSKKVHTDVFLGEGRKPRCNQVIESSFVTTNRGNGCYKFREPLLLQIRAELLQIVADITNQGRLITNRGNYHSYLNPINFLAPLIFVQHECAKINST